MMLAVALLPLYVAVMVAVPAETPLAVPPDTVAMAELLELHEAAAVTTELEVFVFTPLVYV